MILIDEHFEFELDEKKSESSRSMLNDTINSRLGNECPYVIVFSKPYDDN